MDVQRKVELYNEWKKSGWTKGKFAKKRNISDTVFRRIVSDKEAGKFDSAYSRPSSKRIKTPPYAAVERKIVTYIESRCAMNKTGRDKCGLSYCILQLKALEWAKECLSAEAQASFHASPKWVYNVLLRNNFIGLNLHGESNEMSDEEASKAISDFSLSVEVSKAVDNEKGDGHEDEVVERVTPVSHYEGDELMAQLRIYVSRSNHNFPTSVQNKAESLFADIKQHRCRSISR